MLELFKDPVLKDADDTRKAQILHRVIKGTMVIFSIMMVLALFVLPQNYMRWISMILIIDLSGLAFLFLNKKGFQRLASGLFILLWIGVLFIMSITAGGIRSVAWQFLPVMVLIVGLTIGWKSGLKVGMLVLIFGLGLVLAEKWNMLPPSQVTYNAFSLWIGSFIIIALISMLQYNAVEFLNQAFKKVNEELNLRKKAEKELFASEAFRKRVFETSKTPIVVMDGESFKYIDFNRAAIDIYGYHSYEETLGKTPLDVSAERQYDGQFSSEKTKVYIDEANKKGQVIFEWLHQRPNGEMWDAEVHLMSFYSENKLFLQFNLKDITEHKRAEALLKKEQGLNQAIMDSVPGILYLYDYNGKLVRWNKKHLEVTGLTSEETLNMHVLDHLQGREPETTIMSNAIQKVFTTGYAEAEIDFETLDGLKPYFFNGVAIYIDDKAYLAGIGLDISERKKAEKALRESEERFKTLSSIATEGLMIHENGIIIDMNQVFARLLGYLTTDELIGKEALETIQFTPESKQLVYDHFISNSDETFDIEIINLDGKIIPAETRGTEIVYKGRKANLVYMRDISDRKKAEKALKESEELFKSLIDLTPYGISLNDFQGRFLMVNKAFCEDWGFKADEVIGKSKEEIGLCVEEEFEKLMKNELLSNGFYNNIEGTIQSKKGNTFHFLFSSRLIKMNNQNVLLTSSVNITERKIIEKELEKYRNHLEILVKERTDELAATNEELNASNEELYEQREELQASLNKLHEAQKRLVQAEKMASLGVLSAGIAHEINNPLNFIQGGIMVIEKYSNSNLQEHLQELNPFIEAIQIGVRRAADIVTSLSHYSRKDEFPMTECNIHSIIDNCLIMLQNQLKNKVVIEKQYTDKPYTFIGSEGKMHQAILNIIANAEQAIEGKGSIVIKSEIAQNHLIITFKDSGSGISQENIKKIFDPFFTTKDPGKGTGLGLSITFNIIHDHNGTIEYESQPGNGTTAIITLPIIKKDKL